VEFVGGVTHDLEAAALLWTLWTESGNHDMPAGFQSPADSRHVPIPSFAVQEMENGAIVPEIVAVLLKFDNRDIGDDPRHGIRS